MAREEKEVGDEKLHVLTGYTRMLGIKSPIKIVYLNVCVCIWSPLYCPHFALGQLVGDHLVNEEHTSRIRDDPQQMSRQSSIQRAHPFLRHNEFKSLHETRVLLSTVNSRLSESGTDNFVWVGD